MRSSAAEYLTFVAGRAYLEAATTPPFAAVGPAIAFVLATLAGCVHRPTSTDLRRCDPPEDALDVFVELAPRSIPEVRVEGEPFEAWHDEIHVPARTAFVLHFESRAAESHVAIPHLGGGGADLPSDGTTVVGLCTGSVNPRGGHAIVIESGRRRVPLEVVTRAAFERWRVVDEGGCGMASFKRPEESLEVWRGRVFFEFQGCRGCHLRGGDHAPSLRAMSQRVRVLEDGTTRVAEERGRPDDGGRIDVYPPDRRRPRPVDGDFGEARHQATLVWKTHMKADVTDGARNDFEDEILLRLRQVVGDGVGPRIPSARSLRASSRRRRPTSGPPREASSPSARP